MRLLRLMLAHALRLGATMWLAWWTYEAFRSLYFFRRPGSGLPGPEGSLLRDVCVWRAVLAARHRRGAPCSGATSAFVKATPNPHPPAHPPGCRVSPPHSLPR